MDEKLENYIDKNIQVIKSFNDISYRVPLDRFNWFCDTIDLYPKLLKIAQNCELNENHMAASDYSCLADYFKKPFRFYRLGQSIYQLDLRNTDYDYSRW